MESKKIVRGLFLAGLLVAGCQSGDTIEQDGNELQTAAMTTLDEALVAGRINAMPQGLVVKELAPVSEKVLAYNESLKEGNKAILSYSAPAFDPVEAGSRIIEQQQQLPLADGLELTISLPKVDYVVGEPVIVRAVLENTSDYMKRLPTRLDPQFQFNSFVVTGPSGRLMGYSPIAIACTRGNMLDEELYPGESVTRDVPVFFHKDGWMFSDVGEYRIQALYRGLTEGAERVDSNVITLVVNPGTEDDQRAADILMGHEQGLFMMWGEGDHLEDGIAALERVVDEYPHTTLATYARYALGSNMSVEFFDGRFNQHRQPQPKAVLDYLLPIADDMKAGRGPILPPDEMEGTFTKIAAAYDLLGRSDAARQARSDLMEVMSN